MDESTTVKDLRKKVINFRDKRDWKKFHNPKDLSAGLSIEASELQEHFLWKSSDEIDSYIKNNIEKVKEEMADIQIFLLSLSDVLNVDLSDAVFGKLKKNDTKYPVEKSKGIAKKYTEL